MMVKCCRVSCAYIWDYHGASERYAQCPRCRTTVSIKKNAVVKEGSDANAL